MPWEQPLWRVSLAAGMKLARSCPAHQPRAVTLYLDDSGEGNPATGGSGAGPGSGGTGRPTFVAGVVLYRLGWHSGSGE